jgi:hypothetical protein
MGLSPQSRVAGEKYAFVSKFEHCSAAAAKLQFMTLTAQTTFASISSYYFAVQTSHHTPYHTLFTIVACYNLSPS